MTEETSVGKGSTSLHIGGGSDSSSGLVGLIDDVFVYDIALTTKSLSICDCSAPIAQTIRWHCWICA